MCDSTWTLETEAKLQGHQLKEFKEIKETIKRLADLLDTNRNEHKAYISKISSSYYNPALFQSNDVPKDKIAITPEIENKINENKKIFEINKNILMMALEEANRKGALFLIDNLITIK